MTKSVLVVDDFAAVAIAMKLAFRHDGRFELAGSATTAAEGLAQLNGQDVVLLDLHLPDMSGEELVRAFRAHSPAAIVLHSAADDTPEVDAVRDLVDAVTTKSQTDDVLAALAAVTGV
jgi:DNA-binding NarL/FixJ family response regulator